MTTLAEFSPECQQQPVYATMQRILMHFCIHTMQLYAMQHVRKAVVMRYPCMQVEQSRFLVPPFTLGESVFVGESRKQQQQQQADEPVQQGGTWSMLAHLRYCSLNSSR